MNLVTSPHEFLHHPSLPSLVTVPKLESVTVAEDEALETWSGHGPDLPKVCVCRPECLLKVLLWCLVCCKSISRSEMILRGHVEKACNKSMLLETILIYVRCSLCTELTGKAIAKNWSCFLRFGFSGNL